MGAWGITMRESDGGLDLLRTIIAEHLKKVDFSTFSVAEAIEIVKADSLDEVRKANRGASADNLIYYISENFPRLFTEGALLIAECLADYYRTGELTVTEYVGENYVPVDHHIKDFTVTKDDLKIGSGWSIPRQPTILYGRKNTGFIIPPSKMRSSYLG